MRTVLFITLAGVALLAICGCAIKGSQGPANNTDGSVTTVTFCELMKHPERFHNKVVRVVDAVFEQEFEQMSLGDRGICNKNNPMDDAQFGTWVSYDKSFVMDGDSDEAKNNQKVSGFGRWLITAVGRFRRGEGPQRFGHLGCCRYDFALIRIEKSEKLPTPR